MIAVNAQAVLLEINTDPRPCADLEPEPFLPGHPYACSRPVDHPGGLHVAMVPLDPDDPLSALIGAVWGES